MAEVTAGRVEQELRRIASTLERTSATSDLPADQQDELLASCCAGACALLRDWLASGYWEQLRPSSDGPLADYLPDQRIIGYLDAELATVLARAGARVPPEMVTDARSAVTALGEHHRRKRRMELYIAAGRLVRTLTSQVCRLADELRQNPAIPAERAASRRERARSALARVGGVVLSITVFMASVGPRQAALDLSEWGRAAVSVYVTYELAAHADPSLELAGPELGL